MKKIAEYRNEEFDEKLKKQMSEIPEEYHNTPRYKELKRLYDSMKLEVYEIKEQGNE